MVIDRAGVLTSPLSPELRASLAARVLAMADDELILAHRNSEWCGHAPILEEDIAFANIAQDELGHAGLWYDILKDLDGADPDRLVFFRPAHKFRNVRMLELPNGDWAFSMLRQYFFDSYEVVALPWLSASTFEPLAQAAAKARPEEIYHLRHTRAWVRRLGLGTEESNRRMQRALVRLWPDTAQLFQPLSGDIHLIEAGVFPPLQELAQAWRDDVLPFLSESGLDVGGLDATHAEASLLRGRDFHTEHLQPLVEELQSVARTDPEASW
jgi:ring-1,2-phenylacetyl-CoA epoxidase subunit PaaC